MAKGNQRTPTLSISLTPELAAAVASRVDTGMYTSASELIREALRLLLKMEELEERRLAEPSGSSVAERFATTMELLEFGRSARVRKLRDLAPEEAHMRIAQLSDAQEGYKHLRESPERLRKLKLDEPG